MTDEQMNDKNIARIGIQGVRLKKYEEVVSDCIEKVLLPTYFSLPKHPSPEKIDLISYALVKQSSHESSNSLLPDTCQEGDSLVSSKNEEIPSPEWPFNILPEAACIRALPGPIDVDRPSGKLSGMRAVKKEWQIRSIIQCLLAMLPDSAFGPITEPFVSEAKIKIVDFGGGTGHLSLPLALLLPKCEVVLVDLKATSLELVHRKAQDLIQPKKSSNAVNDDSFDNEAIMSSKKSNVKKAKRQRPKPPGASRDADLTKHANMIRQCKYMPNLSTYHGSISRYAQQHDFDVGMSLHCCGEGTDIVLRACGTAKASFIVSPCCVGKLSKQKRNPYVYHATSSNEATISYPQSKIFCQTITSSEKFDTLAKAADYSEMKDIRTSRGATRRTAKALLEMDRLLYMKENFEYDDVALTRMLPWEASPKNDILIGWFKYGQFSSKLHSPYHSSDAKKGWTQCSECNADITMAVKQLISPDLTEAACAASSGGSTDWTKEEMEEYEQALNDFFHSDLRVKRFPTGMGKRKRKLVHFLAEKMRFKHWSEGKKFADKIVVIGK